MLALLLPLLPDTKHTNLRIKNAQLAAQAMMKAYLLNRRTEHISLGGGGLVASVASDP